MLGHAGSFDFLNHSNKDGNDITENFESVPIYSK